jgi:ornithine cyclodeaminase/alanine dehydrogenase-like protein (mu-crystallin family)
MLANVIAGDIQGRDSDTQSIYYDNNSAGLQFAAVGRVVYEKAREAGLGMKIPMEWFQQDIRN